VFSSVTSLLNMSVFKDQFVLEDLIQELKKTNAALSFGPLQSNGYISVQGSFPEIKFLRDFLLLKAKSLPEKDEREESKTSQKPKRRLQQHRPATEMNNFVHDATGEKQVVVVDTDIYRYMKHFYPRTFQVSSDVVISDVTDGDVTTISIEKAGSRSGAGQVLRVKERIEKQSLNLLYTLRKERIQFKKHTRDQKQKYTQACESLRRRYPSVLIIPYDTHIDVIGDTEVFAFTAELNK
ncbi:RBM43 protein, partial [Atlantisia rogersi]|nr:RBM43 protein [Atlantisia rogersi]